MIFLILVIVIVVVVAEKNDRKVFNEYLENQIKFKYTGRSRRIRKTKKTDGFSLRSNNN
jgi:uncharacterized membrane protein YciS (DUF1049 family)